jgi:hypothetical protein
MVSTFTTNKHLEEPANGDYVNTWSTPVNANFTAIDTAFGGQTTLNAVSASGIVALTLSQYLPPIIFVTGALTANVNYQFPTGVGGRWSVVNSTTGAFTITFSSAGGGSAIVIPQGSTISIICDGTNVGRSDTAPSGAAGVSGNLQVNVGGLISAYSTLTFNGTNLGVGTSTPAYPLDIAGLGSFSGTGTSAGIRVYNSTVGAQRDYRLLERDTGYLAITDITAGLDRVAVLPNGNVGIGTTSPSTALQVVGAVTATVVVATSDGAAPAGDFQTPNSGTTGGVRIRGSATTNAAIVQFTDSTGVNQWGYGSIVSSGLFTWSGSFTASTMLVNGFSVGYLGLPQSSSTTAASTDVGKHIYTGAGVNINSGVFNAGDAFLVVNSGSSNIAINAGGGVLLRLSGTTTTGNRTIAGYGQASVLCVGGNVFYVSGAGVF